MFWRKRVRVEHTGDGVTRRPTVLKTVAVTGLHALPQLTIHTLAASASFRPCVVDFGWGESKRSFPARKSLRAWHIRHIKEEGEKGDERPGLCYSG